MKYDAKRHLLYPVLSPNNDDYPDGEFTTTLTPPVLDPEGTIAFTIQFHLKEPFLSQCVREGRAKCKAMIYCTSTLYRGDYEAPSGEFTISAKIPQEQLDGTVEVHSFVISIEPISLAGSDIHPEYVQLGVPLDVSLRQPLAAAERQEFNIQRDQSREDPLMAFEEDLSGKIPPGELDIVTNFTDRQIKIIMHETTYNQVLQLRNDEPIALASFYMSALVQACCIVYSTPPEEAEDAYPQGWFHRLRERQQEGIEPFRMAQIIFGKPFEKLLTEAT